MDEKGIVNFLKNYGANTLGLAGLSTPFAGANLAFGNIEVYVTDEDVEKSLEIIKTLFGNEEENNNLTEFEETEKGIDSEEFPEYGTNEFTDRQGRKWRKSNEKSYITIPDSNMWGTSPEAMQTDGLIWELVDEEDAEKASSIMDSTESKSKKTTSNAKTENRVLICPKCKKQIESSNINIVKDVAFCAPCGEIHKISVLMGRERIHPPEN